MISWTDRDALLMSRWTASVRDGRGKSQPRASHLPTSALRQASRTAMITKCDAPLAARALAVRVRVRVRVSDSGLISRRRLAASRTRTELNLIPLALQKRARCPKLSMHPQTITFFHPLSPTARSRPTMTQSSTRFPDTVLLFGQTGAGKSSFTRAHGGGAAVAEIGETEDATTKKCTTYITHGGALQIIDTPGFRDTAGVSDQEHLRLIIKEAIALKPGQLKAVVWIQNATKAMDIVVSPFALVFVFIRAAADSSRPTVQIEEARHLGNFVGGNWKNVIVMGERETGRRCDQLLTCARCTKAGRPIPYLPISQRTTCPSGPLYLRSRVVRSRPACTRRTPHKLTPSHSHATSLPWRQTRQGLPQPVL